MQVANWDAENSEKKQTPKVGFGGTGDPQREMAVEHLERDLRRC